MKQKYTLIEGNDALNKTLLMMRYDVSKTLNENLVSEQTQNNKNSFFLQNQPTNKKPSNKKGIIHSIKPDMGEIGDLGDINKVRYLKKAESPTTFEDVGKFIYDNRHGLIDIAAVGTAIIPLVGPFISLGLELGNAALYASEGDKYTAGLATAFALIPGGQLIRRIPAIKKLGRNGMAKLLKKVRNPKLAKTLSEIEKEVLESINKNSKWAKLTAAQQLSKKMAYYTISKIKLPQLVKLVYSLSKKYPNTYNITSIGLQIGGIWYSYDKLAEIYGIKPKSPKTDKENKTQPTPKELESEFNKNKNEDEIIKVLTGGLTDEEKNLKFQKSLSDAKREISQDGE
jgi:hypothetical protein